MPIVLDEISTLGEIVKRKCSIARYGDGELAICMGRGIDFQGYDENLSTRLREILKNEPTDNLLICLAPHMNSSYLLTMRVKNFYYKYFARNGKKYLDFLNPNMKYGSACISRPDSFLFKGDQLVQYKELLRKLWVKRDLLIVTGKNSRFTLIEDLFDNIKSSEFIYGPSTDAFSQYSEIMEQIKSYSREYLVLLALGPTATVLAYDLAREGYQAIDIGHLPSCYKIVTSDSRPYKLGY
jgi:glycosyltransferase family protein